VTVAQRRLPLKKTLAGGITVVAAAAVLPLALAACSTLPSDVAAGAPDVDKATQMTSNITNNTQEDLTLVSASHAGGVTHWQDQAPKTLAAGATAKVTDYGSGDNSMTIIYQDATGAKFTFKANDPLIGNNSSSATTTSTSYAVTASNSSGHDDWTTFTVAAGHTFDFTGATQTYTVPAGVTELRVDLTGGAGGMNRAVDHEGYNNGAEITGTLAVTPGDVLTVGVGGSADDHPRGGWGMSYNGSSFSGGDAADLQGSPFQAFGGGGASVIELNGQIVAVAGGSGGVGQADSDAAWSTSGQAGINGSLTGGNGGPGNTGGKGGSLDDTQGGSPTSSSLNDPNAGAGGGGWKGGAAGMDGSYGGGGAGSSYDADLTSPTVKNSPEWSGDEQHDGRLILTAAN
jgi:hypothetical protein